MRKRLLTWVALLGLSLLIDLGGAGIGAARTPVRAGEVLSDPPVVVTPPAISGTPHKGSTLTCTTGEWAGNPSTFAWQWNRGGAPVEGATAQTYSVFGSDVDSLIACAVTATNEFGSTTALSLEIEIVRIAVRILKDTRRTQAVPTIRVEGRVVTELPSKAGVLELLERRGDQTVRVARTRPRAGGGFLLEQTIWALVPGKYPFTLRFVPHDRELYEGLVVPIRVTVVSPSTYPFPRTRFERRPSRFDRLTPFWLDRQRCSIGCRPAGAVAGWPLKPFHEQHPLRAGINERRRSGFHLGIDIQAVGMRKIYAIQSGRAHIIKLHSPDARVQIGNFIYWHVRLAIREGEYVPAYRKAVGIVMPHVRHLHLSEVDGSDLYLNPLRPLGRVLAPWEDLEPPVIGRPQVYRDGTAFVSVFDPQSYVVRTGYETPVLAPAAIAYRLFDGNARPIGPLQWALRGSQVLPNALVGAVFMPDAHSPGFLCFAFRIICVPHWRYHLAGGLAPRVTLPAPGHRYRLSVYAWDWKGNTRARDTWLTR